jgi:hypothetical protein
MAEGAQPKGGPMIAPVWPVTIVRTLVLILAALLFSSPLALAQYRQQAKLVDTSAIGTAAFQGASVALSSDGSTAIVGAGQLQVSASVALSSDGNTAIVGSPYGNAGRGGKCLQSQRWHLEPVGQPDAIRGLFSGLGSSVALSGDATTALVGGDNSDVGAAWVYAQQTLTGFARD